MGRPRKVVTFSEAQVSVPLNEKQHAVKSRDLARLCDQIDSARAAAKADASGARKKIRSLEDQRRILAECVLTGTEKQNAQADLFGRTKGSKAKEEDLLDEDADADGEYNSAEEAARAMLGPVGIDAKDAFEAPVPALDSGDDQRNAFLANKGATRPPASILDGRTQEERDADAQEAFGEIVEREATALERADTAEQQRPVRASDIPAISTADYADAFDQEPEVATPAETPKSKRGGAKRNGKPDDGHKAS